MNLIDRYVYAVTRRLPEKQKADIEKELKTLIDDMLEQHQGDESYDNKVQKVLVELGDPSLLADSYRESKRYLIGPQNFENYLLILKIVLGAVFLGISIASIVGIFVDTQPSIIDIVVNYLAILFGALMQAFAWVTIAFAIAEYNGVKLSDKAKMSEGWSIAELPELPQKEARISRGETIFSILFTTVFISILCFAPQLVAAYIKTDSLGTTVIPVFNLEAISRFNLLFVMMFILSVAKEVLKFYFGRWTLKLSIPVSILSIATAIITVAVFTNQQIWNTNFPIEVMKHFEISPAPTFLWNGLGNGLVIVVILATVIEVATALYKGVKFNR